MADDTDLISGRNAVLEALKSDRPLNKVFLQKSSPLRQIEALAKSRGVPVIYTDKAWFDKKVKGVHQGAAASASVKEYCDVGDILDYAAERGEKPLIVVTNKLYDTHNLGAIIRSSEAAGVHGIIIPKRNAAGLTGAVAKTSAGAIEYMRIARVPNVADALRNLKKQGVWIVGADASGDTPYTGCDMTDGTAIVIGGESEGLGKLVSGLCDFTVSLPMLGKISSLNASAAAAVLLYEAQRQRMQTKKEL